jgi:hypothetical protein
VHAKQLIFVLLIKEKDPISKTCRLRKKRHLGPMNKVQKTLKNHNALSAEGCIFSSHKFQNMGSAYV